MALAKNGRISKKREPEVLFYDPDSSHVSRGQLLSGVRRQQQDQGNDEQDENKFPHGVPSFSRLRRADALAGG